MGTEDIFEDVTMALYGRSVEASVDPMCGTEVEHTPTAVSLRLGNDLVYFCSDFCRKRFRQDRSEAAWLTQVGKRRHWRTLAVAPEAEETPAIQRPCPDVRVHRRPMARA